VSFDTILWTMGRYDMVAILDAPDAKTVAAALVPVAQAGGLGRQHQHRDAGGLHRR